MARAAPVAEEIAALRGTRPSSLKELLTHRSFSRLLRAMLVSSLGDWVGFVAVASLVADEGGERLGALAVAGVMLARLLPSVDRKSTRLNSSHVSISYAVFCLKKK